MFFKCTKHIHTSGPLYLLFTVSGILFPEITVWISPSRPSSSEINSFPIRDDVAPEVVLDSSTQSSWEQQSFICPVKGKETYLEDRMENLESLVSQEGVGSSITM